MRLSRPCYDKPHRCPGWAGGGWTSGSYRHPCVEGGGSIRVNVIDPYEYARGDVATCTCGRSITKISDHMLWRDNDEGSTSCPQVQEGLTLSHRPPRTLLYPPSRPWRFGRCIGHKGNSYTDEVNRFDLGCGVVTWPHVARFLDPTWYRIYLWRLRWRKDN